MAKKGQNDWEIDPELAKKAQRARKDLMDLVSIKDNDRFTSRICIQAIEVLDDFLEMGGELTRESGAGTEFTTDSESLEAFADARQLALDMRCRLCDYNCWKNHQNPIEANFPFKGRTLAECIDQVRDGIEGVLVRDGQPKGDPLTISVDGKLVDGLTEALGTLEELREKLVDSGSDDPVRTEFKDGPDVGDLLLKVEKDMEEFWVSFQDQLQYRKGSKRPREFEPDALRYRARIRRPWEGLFAR